MLEGAGVTPLRLPAKSSNLNAYVERIVRSIKEECLDRVVPLGKRHLRAVVSDFMIHYHQERNHQGLGDKLIAPGQESTAMTGRVHRRERVGEILNYYYRTAA